MICDVCKAEMVDSTTEKEVSGDGKTFKVTNVPALICPSCGKVVVEDIVEKMISKFAKRSKDGDTLDFNDVKSLGIGFGEGLK